MSQKIKDLIKKREKIKIIKIKTEGDKVELSMLCKLTKKELKDFNKNKMENMIQEIPTTNYQKHQNYKKEPSPRHEVDNQSD